MCLSGHSKDSQSKTIAIPLLHLQKVIQSISSSLEELNLRVQQLEQEKLDLETRNRMLRKVWRSTSEVLSPPLGAEGKVRRGLASQGGRGKHAYHIESHSC